MVAGQDSTTLSKPWPALVAASCSFICGKTPSQAFCSQYFDGKRCSQHFCRQPRAKFSVRDFSVLLCQCSGEGCLSSRSHPACSLFRTATLNLTPMSNIVGVALLGAGIFAKGGRLKRFES